MDEEIMKEHPRQGGRRRRSIPLWSVVVSVVLVVGVTVPAPAGELGGGGDVVSGVGGDDGGGVHQPAIDALRRHVAGVFAGTGCAGGLCPGESLLRWEMAVWLVRVLDRADPPPQVSSQFDDVDGAVWWAPFADRLAELGVTDGCATGPLRFCPALPVSRAEMAAFLVRAFDLKSAPAAGFVDTAGSTHESSIDALAAAGVTEGCGKQPLRYCPDQSVTRGEVATFLARTLGLLPDPDEAPARFGDVGEDDPEAASIARLLEEGVLDGTGCGDGGDLFCSDDPLDRKTLAVWLVRVLDGANAPGFGDASTGGASRFADVAASLPERPFVERLADLGVASGCGGSPTRFCPDEAVSRAVMAIWLDRAFGFPDVDMEGFVDVDEGTAADASARRVWAAGIDDGCIPEGPLLFCPGNSVSRGQTAVLLAKSADWKKNNDRLKPTGTDDSIGLTIDHDDPTIVTTVSWRQPRTNPDQVSHYVVQWRNPWDAFGSQFHKLGFHRQRHKVVAVNANNSPNYELVLSRDESETHGGPYAVRVITFYDDGQRLASNEVKVQSSSHRLQDLIEERIIEPHQDAQPWLRDTWRFVNSPRFTLNAANGGGASVSFKTYSPKDLGQLQTTYAQVLEMPPATADYFYRNKIETIVHEFGHVYVETGNITRDRAGVGAGRLYLSLLRKEYINGAKRPEKCSVRELYADLAMFTFIGGQLDPNWGVVNSRGGSWGACGFGFEGKTKEEVAKNMSDIAQAVFVDQRIPDWFVETYQNSDRSAKDNLDRLWSDMLKYLMPGDGHPSAGGRMKSVVYDLRQEFGGYCSQKRMRAALSNDVSTLQDHWRDAGCQPEPEPEPEETSDDNPSTTVADNEVGTSSTGTAPPANYPLSYLSKARSRPTNCWIAVNGYVYDVTPREGGYEYPGPGSIVDLCGQDATATFRANNIPAPPDEYRKGTLRQ